MRPCHAKNTMTVEFTSSPDSLVDYKENRTVTLLLLQTALKNLMGASDRSSTNLTLTTVMQQKSYRQICLD